MTDKSVVQESQPTAKVKHVGMMARRLHKDCDNPREVAFAKAWQEQNDMGHTLEHLLSETPNKRSELVTDRDRVVAATIIQWLGSNVGMCFLRDTIQSCPECQNWFKVL